MIMALLSTTMAVSRMETAFLRVPSIPPFRRIRYPDHQKAIKRVMKLFNSSRPRDQWIHYKKARACLEEDPMYTCYCFIDDICTKHQKEKGLESAVRRNPMMKAGVCYTRPTSMSCIGISDTASQHRIPRRAVECSLAIF